MNYVKFDEACKKNGTTPTALFTKLGLSKGNSTSWKKGGNPSVDVLINIAQELDVSIDYLLDIDKKTASNEQSLNEKDKIFSDSLMNVTEDELKKIFDYVS